MDIGYKAKQLKECKNIVYVSDSDELQFYRAQIQRY